MTKELVEVTKKAIGYTEQNNTCAGCKHSSEEEDAHLDRSWSLVCKVNSICPFVISQNGRCNLFAPKQEK